MARVGTFWKINQCQVFETLLLYGYFAWCWCCKCKAASSNPKCLGRLCVTTWCPVIPTPTVSNYRNNQTLNNTDLLSTKISFPIPGILFQTPAILVVAFLSWPFQSQSPRNIFLCSEPNYETVREFVGSPDLRTSNLLYRTICVTTYFIIPHWPRNFSLTILALKQHLCYVIFFRHQSHHHPGLKLLGRQPLSSAPAAPAECAAIDQWTAPPEERVLR